MSWSVQRGIVLLAVCRVALVAGVAEALPGADPVAVAHRLASASGAGGHAPLAALADELSGIPAEAIVPCLEAFRTATPAGANWLRSGLDRAVVAHGVAAPRDAIAAAVADRRQPARARSLAHGWLERLDPDRASGLLDGMLEDPVLDLRRAAIDRLLASAPAADEEAAKGAYRRGLAAARDVDQIERIAGWLAEHGEKVDVAQVLGFVRRWRVSAAFDNVGGAGFAKPYPPEAAAQVDATGWKPVQASDAHGTIDLNAAVAPRKGVLAYAIAEVEMPQAGAADVRIGSPCAVAVWVNGRPVMTHEIYHASEAVDQYVTPAEFRAGTNTILVKCCQNEQTEPWAADWKFQLRVTDALGAPLATQAVEAGR